MKKVLFSVLAVLLTAAMVVSFAACGGNETPETTTVAGVEAEATTAADVADETTAAEADTTVAEDETTAVDATEAATEADATTVADETTAAADVAVPADKAAIVALYNEASAKAVSSKAGFKKTVSTELQNLEMGAIGKIEAVRGAVGGFLGEGTETVTVKKGTASKEITKSTLTAADVTAATCKLSADGKYYEVTLTVKNEIDPAKGKSALNRFTNDYKDNKEMVDGLASEGASTETIKTTVKTATVKAKIAVDSKEFSSLDYTIKIDCLLTKVKYMVSVKQVTGTIYTTVKYSGFAY